MTTQTAPGAPAQSNLAQILDALHRIEQSLQPSQFPSGGNTSESETDQVVPDDSVLKAMIQRFHERAKAKRTESQTAHIVERFFSTYDLVEIIENLSSDFATSIAADIEDGNADADQVRTRAFINGRVISLLTRLRLSHPV